MYDFDNPAPQTVEPLHVQHRKCATIHPSAQLAGFQLRYHDGLIAAVAKYAASRRAGLAPLPPLHQLPVPERQNS